MQISIWGVNLVTDVGIEIILHCRQSFPNSHSDLLSLGYQVNSNSDLGGRGIKMFE